MSTDRYHEDFVYGIVFNSQHKLLKGPIDDLNRVENDEDLNFKQQSLVVSLNWTNPKTKFTPLTLCDHIEQKDAFDLLLSASRLDINKRNDFGYNALDIVCKRRFPDFLNKLLERRDFKITASDLNANTSDNEKKPSIYYLIINKEEISDDGIDRNKFLKIILEHCELNDITVKNYYLFKTAFWCGNLDAIILLSNRYKTLEGYGFNEKLHKYLNEYLDKITLDSDTTKTSKKAKKKKTEIQAILNEYKIVENIENRGGKKSSKKKQTLRKKTKKSRKTKRKAR